MNCGKGERLELLVGVDVHPSRAVDGKQPDLVEISDLAQLFGNAHFERTVAFDQLVAAQVDVLVVVDGKELAAQARAQEALRRTPR
ncbi:MAG: hypothetical protein R2748_10165 [Bryobacterales bacterium]